MEINASFLPLPLDGPFADPPHRCDFGERKTTKKPQVNDFSERWFSLGEFVQRVADSNQLPVINRILDLGFKRRKLEFATTLLSPATPCMVNNQATHHPSCVAHESAAIGEVRPILMSNLYVRLMEKSRGTQAHRRAVPG
jgi:hypothetical protein